MISIITPLLAMVFIKLLAMIRMAAQSHPVLNPERYPLSGVENCYVS